jgi:transcriptional repressor NrdR
VPFFILIFFWTYNALSNILNSHGYFKDHRMKCPYCHHTESKVTDSRDAGELNAIRRRRECLKCLRRFTTFETIELTLQVHKRDGRYEDFQQQKLIDGIQAACRHTTISRDQVIMIANKVTGELIQRCVQEISTTEIGNLAMQHLQSLDPIAYIRFTCVYKRFKNIGELMEAIHSIQSKDDAKRINKYEKVVDGAQKS